MTTAPSRTAASPTASGSSSTIRSGYERLTLNLGVRFDHNNATIPDLDVLDQNGSPTGGTVPGRELYAWNRLSPRLGFNCKLTKDGKTALRAHLGR